MTAARRVGEMAAVAIGLAVFGYLGWDGALWDPRFQLALHLAGIAGSAAFSGLAWPVDCCRAAGSSCP